MAIRRLLSEAVFSPEEVGRLTAAFEAAIKLVRLKDPTDPLAELIATKIIQVFRLGERDPPRLVARALKELGVPIPDER